MERSDGKRRTRAGVAVEERIICCLLKGMTWRATCAAVGCSMKCIQQKNLQPEFLAKLSKARHELVRRTIDRTSTFAFEALITLRKLHLDMDKEPAIRLKAAATLLDAAINMAAIDKLEQRLTELEQRHSGKPMRVVG